MPHRALTVSRFPYMTVQLGWSSKNGVNIQPSPASLGISVKALQVRAERSNGGSRHEGKQIKRKAAGLDVSKYKAAEQS